MRVLANLASNAVAWYKANPAKGNAYVAAAVSAGLGALGFAASAPEVLTIVAVVVPIVIGGFKTHKKVTPV